VEPLEDRRLLAVRMWDGGGTNNLWSNPVNWIGDVAPQPEDNLVFPTGGTQHTNLNDFAAETRFRSVTVAAADYAISEKTAGANGIILLEGFVYDAVASGAEFTVPITLGAAQTFQSANPGAAGQLDVIQGTLVLNKDRSGAATPMPFYGSLWIGDNRDGVSTPEAAKVILMGRDQISETNWAGTGLTSLSVYSNGTLDLNGKHETVGHLNMFLGRSSASLIATGAGTLALMGDLDVNAFQGSSGATPPAEIRGNLDLGTFFTGVGDGRSGRTIAVNDTALFSMNPDLLISANISGAAHVSVHKTGGGTLRLTGNNTYEGVTRLTAGIVDIGSDTALGNSSLVSIAGGSLRVIGGGQQQPASGPTGDLPVQQCRDPADR
jgi:autotransporter-associated beta strand protein